MGKQESSVCQDITSTEAKTNSKNGRLEELVLELVAKVARLEAQLKLNTK